MIAACARNVFDVLPDAGVAWRLRPMMVAVASQRLGRKAQREDQREERRNPAHITPYGNRDPFLT
jgi:hypothetical protein